MFRSNRILGVDIGASSVKLGEFLISKSGGLQLANFHWAELGLDNTQEENRGPAIISTIQLLLKERKIKSGPAVISVSGQSVFTRFVKLPVVEEKKVLQIVKYEAAQNVPFPIEEVVWDYQLIGGAESKELEVVLVAIKSDIIEELARYVEKAGLKTQLVDVATMALYNAVRYNYGELSGCTLLLDVGARTANLIFIEKQKIFSRNMPIAGNSITQTISSELQIPFPQAEDLKRKIGFVGLGGAYEEPSSEQAAKVSKIIRNVMTRLHAGISQTINFYRTQHGGRTPVRLLLSGGTCIIPYTDQFFREKLNIEVAYFNPFKSIELGPNVRKEDLSKCAHFFGEVVGLGLRRMSECPIEVNLIPKSVARRENIEKKYPYFAATLFCVLLGLLCWVAYANKVAKVYKEGLDPLQAKVTSVEAIARSVDRENAKFSEVKQKVDQLQWLVGTRTQWLELLNELNTKLPPDELWLIQFSPRVPAAAAAAAARPRATEDRFQGGRGGRDPMQMPDAAPAAPEPEKKEDKQKAIKVEFIDIQAQGIIDPRAESKRYDVVKQFVENIAASTNVFAAATRKENVLDPGGAAYTFSIEVKLAKPIQVRP